jgi:hypothetical protein
MFLDWKCEDCGRQDGSVQEMFCPYREEIRNEQIIVRLCPDCRRERCMDI